MGFNTPSTTIAPPPATVSLVIERLDSNNCARFSSSLSPRSPISALLTLGASLIKKAVTLSTDADRPVAA